MFRRAMVVGIVFLFMAHLASGDVLLLKDGRVIVGKIIEETSSSVVIDTVLSSIRASIPFRRSEIKEIRREPLPANFYGGNDRTKADTKTDTQSDGKSRVKTTQYIEIPIVGQFGVDILPAGVQAALDAAHRRGVKHIVFRINSNGGYASAATGIMKVMQVNSDRFTYIAVVERALSAAIWVVFSCDKVIVRPGAVIGAAVGYRGDVSTGDASVDAKFNSAIAAELSAVAEGKGFDPLLVRAMIIPEARVYLVHDSEGALRIVDTPPSDEDLNVRTLDTDTTILTLTAKNVVEVGLGVMTAAPVDSLASRIGVNRWHKLGKIGRLAMENAAHEQRVKTAQVDRGKRKAIDLKNRQVRDLEETLLQIESLAKYIDDGINQAQGLDPAQYTYYYHAYGGHYTASSQRKWKHNTDIAIDAWMRVDNALAALIKLDKKSRRLGSDGVLDKLDVQTHIDIVDDNLRRLREERNRVGP